MFEILITDEVREQLNRLKTDKGLAKRYKAVKKSLMLLSQNPKRYKKDIESIQTARQLQNSAA